MNKYLNILIISFFSVLTIFVERLGFALFIPIVCFLAFNNNKNILLIIPSSLLGVLWFNIDYLLVLVLIFGVITIYLIISKNYQTHIINLSFVFALSLVSLSYNVKSFDEFSINILFSLISVILYAYFCYNLEGVFSKNSRERNFTYTELIMAVIAVIGAAYVNIRNVNLGVFVAIYFAMYFSKNDYPLHSVFFSLVTMFFLRLVFGLEESLIIPFVACFYMFPSIYSIVSLVCFCLLGMLAKIDMFPTLTLQITIGLSIFFELIKFTVVSNNTKNTIIRGVYQQAMENINNEVISFASFLDLFAKEFSTPREYTEKITEGVNNITTNYCESCYVKKECNQRNKGKLYGYFKALIIYSKRKDFGNDDPELQTFFKSCPYIVEIRKSSMLINEKLSLQPHSSKANTLVSQLNGISNILRQYSVDNSLKSELDYDVFTNIHKGICDYGFNICFFEAKKISQADFIIEVGIRGEVFTKLKVIIEGIADKFLSHGASCLFKSADKGKTYVSIVPKINFEIDYGYGSLAQEGNNISGDNYIIKQLSNSKLIAAISDGMGKGYFAHQESNKTLKLVDKITESEINPVTSIQILNTFYFIQDYLEKYSTLDFLEIDRNKGELLSYKMGAASTYLFHKDNSYEKIINESLPFGIEEIIDATTLKINDEDLIVMASDGVFENIVDEKDLELFINGIKHLSPQKITYEILNYARNHKKQNLDDMSVIALKIIKAT